MVTETSSPAIGLKGTSPGQQPNKQTNRKDCMKILKEKKKLKSMDHATLNLPQGAKVFINESLCTYYRVSGMYARNSRIKT